MLKALGTRRFAAGWGERGAAEACGGLGDGGFRRFGGGSGGKSLDGRSVWVAASSLARRGGAGCRDWRVSSRGHQGYGTPDGGNSPRNAVR